MTERGLPIMDGAPACPFVAFDDDREERASSPDSHHRCYAEVRPAPRALAHQGAYCLTSAFGACPTFQDWARRESARTRGESARTHDEASAQDDGHGRAGRRDQDEGRGRDDGRRPQAGRPPFSLSPGSGRPFPSTGPAPDQGDSDEPIRRNPQRSWAAPPPWMGSFDDDQFARQAGPGRPVASGQRPAEPGPRRPDAGLAGSLAHRIAMDGQLDEPDPRGLPPTRPRREVVDPVPRTVGRDLEPPYPPGARRPPLQGEPGWDEDDEDFDVEEEAAGSTTIASRDRLGTIGASAGAALSRVGGMVPRGQPAVSHVSQPRPRPSRHDPAVPAWERPVRYEAYPTLRTRMGLPAISRLVLVFAAVLLAAAVLFLLPGILGVGAPKASPTPLPVPSRSSGPTFSLAPSPTPGPTFATYVVQVGDTMSKIAARFGVPLTVLIDANKEKYPNPDRIAAGDSLIIPSALPSALKDATPTKSPGKSP